MPQTLAVPDFMQKGSTNCQIITLILLEESTLLYTQDWGLLNALLGLRCVVKLLPPILGPPTFFNVWVHLVYYNAAKRRLYFDYCVFAGPKMLV